jgi:hypothetical protein
MSHTVIVANTQPNTREAMTIWLLTTSSITCGSLADRTRVEDRTKAVQGGGTGVENSIPIAFTCFLCRLHCWFPRPHAGVVFVFVLVLVVFACRFSFLHFASSKFCLGCVVRHNIISPVICLVYSQNWQDDEATSQALAKRLAKPSHRLQSMHSTIDKK